MGTSGFPEIYTQARGRSPSASVYFRQITSAHVTTNIFHLGESPASVHGNCWNALRVYLYGTM